MIVSSHPQCVREGCKRVGVSAFVAQPDEMRCSQHHDAELKRRIAALEAARGMFLALVG